jgi:hypothetical protein
LTSNKISAAALIIFVMLSQTTYSQRTKSSLSAGNQRHSEKSLKDNRYFFNFINTTVTNTGTDEEKKILIEAARRDLISRMLYMKFSFNPAMNEIRTTQLLLIDLFSRIAIREIQSGTQLLNEIAPEVLKTGNKASKKYMSLGYRSADWAEKVMIMSDNLPEKNYSIKIYEYVKAIKNAKYCKRYAIIALIENRIPPEKRGRINYNKYNTVKELIDLYITENKEKYSRIHSDNFYKIEATASVYDAVISNPELDQIPEYKNYIKEN